MAYYSAYYFNIYTTPNGGLLYYQGVYTPSAYTGTYAPSGSYDYSASYGFASTYYGYQYGYGSATYHPGSAYYTGSFGGVSSGSYGYS